MLEVLLYLLEVCIDVCDVDPERVDHLLEFLLLPGAVRDLVALAIYADLEQTKIKLGARATIPLGIFILEEHFCWCDAPIEIKCPTLSVYVKSHLIYVFWWPKIKAEIGFVKKVAWADCFLSLSDLESPHQGFKLG